MPGEWQLVSIDLHLYTIGLRKLINLRLAKNNRPPTGGAVSISYGYVLDTVKVDLINAIRLLLSFWATVRYQRNSATGPEWWQRQACDAIIPSHDWVSKRNLPTSLACTADRPRATTCACPSTLMTLLITGLTVNNRLAKNTRLSAGSPVKQQSRCGPSASRVFIDDSNVLHDRLEASICVATRIYCFW